MEDTKAASPAQVVDTSLDKEFEITFKFKKQQWINIWNILLKREYIIGEAMQIMPLLKDIEPIVAQLSDKDIKPAENKVVSTPEKKDK